MTNKNKTTYRKKERYKLTTPNTYLRGGRNVLVSGQCRLKSLKGVFNTGGKWGSRKTATHRIAYKSGSEGGSTPILKSKNCANKKKKRKHKRKKKKKGGGGGGGGGGGEGGGVILWTRYGFQFHLGAKGMVLTS